MFLVRCRGHLGGVFTAFMTLFADFCRALGILQSFAGGMRAMYLLSRQRREDSSGGPGEVASVERLSL